MITTKRVTGAAARRASNRESMRAAILDTARAIVTDSGIDGLTIRGVAAALNYSPGAIYEYFASKEDILKTLYFEGTSGLGGQIARAIDTIPPGTNAVESLMVLGRAYREQARANPELYRLIFGGLRDIPLVSTEDQAESWRGGGFDALLDVARQGIDEGSFVHQSPLVIALAAWSAVHGYVSLELYGRIPAEPESPDIDQNAASSERDPRFETVLRMLLVGIVTDTYRSAHPVADTPNG